MEVHATNSDGVSSNTVNLDISGTAPPDETDPVGSVESSGSTAVLTVSDPESPIRRATLRVTFRIENPCTGEITTADERKTEFGNSSTNSLDVTVSHEPGTCVTPTDPPSSLPERVSVQSWSGDALNFSGLAWSGSG